MEHLQPMEHLRIFKKIKLLLLRTHMDVNKNNSFINVVSAQSSALPRQKDNSIYHNVLPANFTLPARIIIIG